jgi:ssDNA-binding replication factor A large subunit
VASEIRHIGTGKELRFGSRRAAEEYIQDSGGMLDDWEFRIAPSRGPAWDPLA